jgi:hypothetical protein
MKVGGSTSMVEPFPAKPKRMHWRTYDRYRAAYSKFERASFAMFAEFLGDATRRLSAR